MIHTVAKIQANPMCSAEFTFDRFDEVEQCEASGEWGGSVVTNEWEQKTLHSVNVTKYTDHNTGHVLTREDRPQWFKLADQLVQDWLEANE